MQTRPFLLLWLLLSGCISAHRVRIESTPPGAVVSIRGEELGPAPIEITTLYFPYRWYFFGQRTENGWRGGRTTVKLEAPNYRHGRVRMGKHAGWAVLMDYLLLPFPDEFNGPAPWMWKWGHINRILGRTPRTIHEVHLIRKHGAAGSWTPEDAERMR